VGQVSGVFCCGAPATSRLRGLAASLPTAVHLRALVRRHPASMALVAPEGCMRTTRRILKPTCG